MDEVGRGTSTEDGLSLAWAISEYLLHTIKSKTLFATHYHQLTRMEHQNLQMLCMDVLETDGKIIFLRKVIEGSAQNSYGLHVAQLAGIPLSVVNRAQSILETIVKNSNIYTDSNSDLFYTQKEESKITTQLKPSNNLPGLFSDEEMIIDSILSTDVNSITPLEALAKISEWKKLLSTN
jgi:DNA mismatch repair protein MutS